MIMAVLVIAGCTSPPSTATPSPTPAPTAPPSATPSPGNQTIEREYQFVERFNSGIEHYNAGIGLMKQANSTAAAGDHANASQTMLLARDRMDSATDDFRAMKQYAGSATEISFSDKWVEIAGDQSMSFQNASDAYAEYAVEKGRPNPNLVKYNGYVAQANYYSALAVETRKQADALQSMITFMAPPVAP